MPMELRWKHMYPSTFRLQLKNYCNLGPRIRTYKIVRKARMTSSASLRSFNDEQKKRVRRRALHKSLYETLWPKLGKGAVPTRFEGCPGLPFWFTSPSWWISLIHVHLHVNHHLYFPAQFVGVALSDLADKPWSLVSSRLPPDRAFVFIAHRVQHSHHYTFRMNQALQSTLYIVHNHTQ